MTTQFLLGCALGGLVGVLGARRGWRFRRVLVVALVLYVLAYAPHLAS